MRKRFPFRTVRVLTLGFALLILLGALALKLPFSSQHGEPLPFADALFTAASAACVTGLAVYDTGTRFTLFGQAVILLLIQIGGLGFMLLFSLAAFLLHRPIGLRQRSVLMDSVGALQMGGVVRLARRALMVTAVCEGGGAVLLLFWFCPRYGLARGLWMSVFHAVSAFCNAGFDLFGTGDSLAAAAGEWYLTGVLMVLIVCGGLGFLVWDDVLSHGWHVRRWRLHSRIVMPATAALFLGGTLAFYLLERSHAFADVPLGQQIQMAAFQSVTCRTAGFYTVPPAALSGSGTLLTMLLMCIGAGSGSTGGGLKVNTAVVVLLSVLAQVRRQRDVEIWGRRLDEENIRRAFSTMSVYLLLCFAGSMALCGQGIRLEDAWFEALSALGTVGLSRGVTPELPVVSQVAVILLMLAGRVGSLSVALAVSRDRPAARRRNVPEKILIG